MDFDYLDKLLDSPDLTYDCFEIFAFYSQQSGIKCPEEYVADYILEQCDIDKYEIKKVDLSEVNDFNLKSQSYWKDFLKLSKRFCHNNFPVSVKAFDFRGLKGCGTDAVPYFAVWTNVVSIDSKGTVTNSEYALKRANERLKLWDETEGIELFDETELEQEIH